MLDKGNHHKGHLFNKEYCCIEIKAAFNTFNEMIEESVAKVFYKKVKESGGINDTLLDAQIRELETTLLAKF